MGGGHARAQGPGGHAGRAEEQNPGDAPEQRRVHGAGRGLPRGQRLHLLQGAPRGHGRRQLLPGGRGPHRALGGEAGRRRRRRRRTLRHRQEEARGAQEGRRRRLGQARHRLQAPGPPRRQEDHRLFSRPGRPRRAQLRGRPDAPRWHRPLHREVPGDGHPRVRQGDGGEGPRQAQGGAAVRDRHERADEAGQSGGGGGGDRDGGRGGGGGGRRGGGRGKERQECHGGHGGERGRGEERRGRGREEGRGQGGEEGRGRR